MHSIRAQPEGTIQTETEGGREEEQPDAQEERQQHHDSLQEEGPGANGYVRQLLIDLVVSILLDDRLSRILDIIQQNVVLFILERLPNRNVMQIVNNAHLSNLA